MSNNERDIMILRKIVQYCVPATRRTPAHVAHDVAVYPTMDRVQARKTQILRTYGMTMVQISAIH